MSHVLSKSRYIRGLQCHRALYFDVYEPKLAHYSSETLALFRAGREFEYTYKSLYPNAKDVSAELGRSVDSYPDFTQRQLLDRGEVVLFEAGFLFNEVLVLADVVVKQADGNDAIHEVKSGSRLTETYVRDASVQYYVAVNALRAMGLRLSTFDVVYNNGEGGFSVADLTVECQVALGDVARTVEELKDVVQGFEPQVELGPHCSQPYPCPYLDHCLALKRAAAS